MSQQTGVLFGVKVTISVFVVMAVIAVFLIAAYYLLPGLRSELTFFSAIIAALGIVYNGYYNAATLRESIDRDKMHRAFEFTKELNEIDRAKIRVFIENNINVSSTAPHEIHSKIIEDEYLHSAIKSMLCVFEDASIAVQKGYVDESTLFASLSFLLPRTFEDFKSFIQEERRRFQDERLFSEIERLSNAWSANRSIITGKQIAPNNL